MNYIELLGYVATALVAGSFLMKDILKLRLVNAAGALGFIVYGFLISSLPVLLLNIFVGGVNAFYIWRMLKTRPAEQVQTP